VDETEDVEEEETVKREVRQIKGSQGRIKAGNYSMMQKMKQEDRAEKFGYRLLRIPERPKGQDALNETDIERKLRETKERHKGEEQWEIVDEIFGYNWDIVEWDGTAPHYDGMPYRCIVDATDTNFTVDITHGVNREKLKKAKESRDKRKKEATPEETEEERQRRLWRDRSRGGTPDTGRRPSPPRRTTSKFDKDKHSVKVMTGHSSKRNSPEKDTPKDGRYSAASIVSRTSSVKGDKRESSTSRPATRASNKENKTEAGKSTSKYIPYMHPSINFRGSYYQPRPYRHPSLNPYKTHQDIFRPADIQGSQRRANRSEGPRAYIRPQSHFQPKFRQHSRSPERSQGKKRQNGDGKEDKELDAAAWKRLYNKQQKLISAMSQNLLKLGDKVVAKEFERGIQLAKGQASQVDRQRQDMERRDARESPQRPTSSTNRRDEPRTDGKSRDQKGGIDSWEGFDDRMQQYENKARERNFSMQMDSVIRNQGEQNRTFMDHTTGQGHGSYEGIFPDVPAGSERERLLLEDCERTARARMEERDETDDRIFRMIQQEERDGMIRILQNRRPPTITSTGPVRIEISPRREIQPPSYNEAIQASNIRRGDGRDDLRASLRGSPQPDVSMNWTSEEIEEQIGILVSIQREREERERRERERGSGQGPSGSSRGW